MAYFFFEALTIVCLSLFFFLMIRRPPRSTLDRSSAASDVYKRQISDDRLKVGVYRVAYNLVKELPSLDAKSNYRVYTCLLYTSPSPRDRTRSRMPSSA